MDKRFEELLTPEAIAERQAHIAQGRYYGGDYNYRYYEAKQIQEVVNAREKLEELAEKLKAHKANGEELLEWIKNNSDDLPGVDCWVWDVSEIHSDDIVGDALNWAASDHSC